MPGTALIPADDSLAALVAIVRAARLTGDRVMERVAQKKLWLRYKVQVAFSPPRKQREEVPSR